MTGKQPMIEPRVNMDENNRLRWMFDSIMADMHEAWDTDHDMRVGKMIIALRGRSRGYMASIDAFLDALDSAVSQEPRQEQIEQAKEQALDDLNLHCTDHAPSADCEGCQAQLADLIAVLRAVPRETEIARVKDQDGAELAS